LLVTAQQVSELLGCAVRTVSRRCVSGKYPGAFKALGNGGEGWMVPIVTLPLAVQQRLANEYAAELAIRAGLAPKSSCAADAEGEYRTLWDAYERKPASMKRKAEKALAALQAHQELRESGRTVEQATKAIAESHGVSGVTLWRYLKATAGHPKAHWLPMLCPKYRGGRGKAEFTQEAYDWILSKYLNTSETKVSVVVREARKQGVAKGWVIPSVDTVAKRLKDEPSWLIIGGRKGEKALERSFPTVERDYPSLRLHEAWESDGRRADVMCRWPDGTIARPFVIVWRELRTRLVISVKGYLHPTQEVVLAAFGSAMERTGAAPEKGKMDNGREYAGKRATGRQKTRYRNKVIIGEQLGEMTRVGTVAHWSKPGQGRDKPVESFWNVIAMNVDQAPEFQGAYCGKDTASKPEDFARDNAIPVEAYGLKLALEVDRFNNRPHRGHGMGGKSPMQLYEELLPGARFTRPDPSHIRLCRMGMEMVKPDSRDGSIRLRIEGYGDIRYWAEEINDLPAHIRIRKLQVYYDIENPKAAVSVYDGEVYICEATTKDRIEFFEESGDKVREHMQGKASYLKPRRAAIKAVKARGVIDLPKRVASDELPPLPQPLNAVQIDMPRKAAVAEPEPLVLQPAPDDPLALVNTVTGEILRPHRPALPLEPRRTPEELDALREAHAEKNKPSWMKASKTA